MIDFVHLLLKEKVEGKLSSLKWTKKLTPDSETFYFHGFRGVEIRYYPERPLISIKGKLLMLLHDTLVLNVDDIYGKDTDRFVAEVNNYLNRLFSTVHLDIRNFSVSRLDYCFNVKTPYVSVYIDFLSTAFQKCNQGRRVDYVQENALYGSVYVKTKRDYEQNERRNYVLNFYDKFDRLQYQKERGERITAEDEERAKDVLRLEVQCGYQFLKEFCKKQKIRRKFGALFSFRLAYLAEAAIYCRVFNAGEQEDYFQYQSAASLFGLKNQTVRSLLLHVSKNGKITDAAYAYAKKKVKQKGIYPFCFIPRGRAEACLKNPLALIAEKIRNLGVDIQ